MKRVFGWMFLGILFGAAVFAVYLYMQGPTYQMPPPTPADTPLPPAAVAEPEIRYPLPDSAEKEKPLPPLAKSDPTVLAALADLFGQKTVKQLFQPQEVVRRIVVTVDNLPRKIVSAQLLPTTRPAGKLRTEGKGETLVLAEENYSRYTPFVRVAEMVDAKAFAAAYTKLYPLFQQAYRELGYPKGYFNDRLVAVIDHMLQAPKVEGPIALVQPHIFYKFADPELESLSAGHKLMLRIGEANAAKVKAKLREIRSELTRAAPKTE